MFIAARDIDLGVPANDSMKPMQAVNLTRFVGELQADEVGYLLYRDGNPKPELWATSMDDVIGYVKSFGLTNATFAVHKHTLDDVEVITGAEVAAQMQKVTNFR